VLAGAGVAAAWLLLVGLLATSAQGYVWWTVAASLAAWTCALALARFGDRGAATGVAMATGLGLAIAVGLALERWATTGWPMW
jgi:hypothetical protein